MRNGWAQLRELVNGVTRLSLGARFEVLAQIDQRDDERSGVIEGDAAHNLWPEGGDNAHEERGGRAQADQHVHVGAEMTHNAPGGAMKLIADVAPDRRGQ